MIYFLGQQFLSVSKIKSRMINPLISIICCQISNKRICQTKKRIIQFNCLCHCINELQLFWNQCPNTQKNCLKTLPIRLITASQLGKLGAPMVTMPGYITRNFRKLRQSYNVPWQVPITEYMVKAFTLTNSFHPSSYTRYSARSPRHFFLPYYNGKICKNSLFISN